MLNLSIQRDLNSAVTKLLNEAPEKINDAIKVALFSIGQEMRGESGADAPFKTGNLRRSITSKATDKDVTVGSNLVYARIHDVGGMAGRNRTTRINPHRGKGYLTPAFKKMKDGKATEIIGKQIINIFK